MKLHTLTSLPSSLFLIAGLGIVAQGCGSDDEDPIARAAKDPSTTSVVAVDRFSAEAGNLFVRDGQNGLPGANEAIDFDQAPFITKGLGPKGEVVDYYNFDVQPAAPAPIFAFFYASDDTPVPGQLNIIDHLPGQDGYSDFWLVNKVLVPDDYKANTVTSLDELTSAGFAVETTDIIVNCPVVPKGSTAKLRGGANESADTTIGWYRGQVVHYFSFEEAPLRAAGGLTPQSPIYVTFNINPDVQDGGPPSGFVTEGQSEQTHNVLATLPGDEAYSPLWTVWVYDNAEFDNVGDLSSAMSATSLGGGAAVNCPVVAIQ